MSFCAAVAAAVTMGIVTAVASSQATWDSNVFTADHHNPVTSGVQVSVIGPGVSHVVPTSFAGKDWPGPGSFGEHWAR
jgi:hypothetical protein